MIKCHEKLHNAEAIMTFEHFLSISSIFSWRLRQGQLIPYTLHLSQNSLIDWPGTCFMLWRASCSWCWWTILVVEYRVLSKSQTSLAVSKQANWSLVEGFSCCESRLKFDDFYYPNLQVFSNMAICIIILIFLFYRFKDRTNNNCLKYSPFPKIGHFLRPYCIIYTIQNGFNGSNDIYFVHYNIFANFETTNITEKIKNWILKG